MWRFNGNAGTVSLDNGLVRRAAGARADSDLCSFLARSPLEHSLTFCSHFPNLRQPGTPANFGRTCTLSAAVLVVIFGIQFAGSQKIGLAYGPIVIVWLLYIGITGIQRINEVGGSVFSAWCAHAA